MRIPAERLDVITLCNTPVGVPAVRGREVADLFLASLSAPVTQAATPPPAAPTAYVPPDAATLAAYAGDYRSSELDLVFTIRASSDGLVLYRAAGDQIALAASAPDRFRLLQRSTLEFRRNGARRITGFFWQGDRVRNIRFERVDR